MRGFALVLLVAVPLSASVVETAVADPTAPQKIVTKAAAKAPVTKRASKAKTANAQSKDVALPGQNYNWSGFYGGFSAGYLSGDSTWANVLPPSNAMNPPIRQGMLGLHIGAQYDIQTSAPFNVILGAEFAYSSPPSRNASTLACVFDTAQGCRTRIDNLLTIGGRLGLGHGNVLLVGLGGYATANVRSEQLTASGACNGGFCDQQRASGWYAGGGLEYKLAQAEFADVIMGVEWQHVVLDTTRQGLASGVISANTRDVNASADIVRVRLSLKFNPFGNRADGDYKIDW